MIVVGDCEIKWLGVFTTSGFIDKETLVLITKHGKICKDGKNILHDHTSTECIQLGALPQPRHDDNGQETKL
jgi:hypothetical protein